jgi:ribosomal protein S18 acetylase RimI-like enzyme
MTTTPDVRVRRASAADAERVAPLFDAYRQFYRQHPDPARALAFISERLERDESVVFVAERTPEAGGAALGFVQLYPSFSSVSACRIWVLNDLFVSPEARGLGVARALMAAARAHAERTGARQVVLSTGRTNAPARALYEGLGYVRDTEFDTYTLALPGSTDSPGAR